MAYSLVENGRKGMSKVKADEVECMETKGTRTKSAVEYIFFYALQWSMLERT